MYALCQIKLDLLGTMCFWILLSITKADLLCGLVAFKLSDKRTGRDGELREQRNIWGWGVGVWDESSDSGKRLVTSANKYYEKVDCDHGQQ